MAEPLVINAEIIQTFLFWAAIVFAAGFIGYFGRYFSKLIIARIHNKEKEPTTEKPVYQAVVKADDSKKYDYKIEKLRMKLKKQKLKSKEKLKGEIEKDFYKELEKKGKQREKERKRMENLLEKKKGKEED